MGRRRQRKRNNDDDDDNGFAAWGGYMAAKKHKLLEQYTEAADSEKNKLSDIFKGISIFVNGYTKPSAEELKNLMALHGGIYHHYHIPAKTTHIIATNLPDTKIKQLGWNNKIVKPEWIVDSIKANKLMNYSNYLLYTNQNRLQPKLNFERIDKNKIETHDDIEKIIENDSKENESYLLSSPDIFSDENNSNDIHIVETKNDKNDEKVITEMFDDENNCSNIHIYETKKEKNIEKIRPDMLDDESNSSDIYTDETKNDKNDERITGQFKPITSVSERNSFRTLNATDPRFLSEFYNNSRLHLISTLGAMFKNRVFNLREQHSFTFPKRENLKQYVKSLNCKSNEEKEFDLTTPVIMHIDMDCFFVSVGLRNRPELKGEPVAVTHSRGGQEPSTRSGVDRQAEIDCYKQKMQGKMKNQHGRPDVIPRLQAVENQSMSEIASCSYEARKAGVKNGMFVGTALKLCPNLKTIPYDFEDYKQVANDLYDTIAEYTLNIEAVSCDEMFVDITDILKETGATVEQWATYIRDLIQYKTGCPCSAGFGANRLQARMATKTAKPNGQYNLEMNNVENYMSDFKVDDLPGVGYSTTIKLHSMGIKTCRELQIIGLSKLQQEFGNKIGKTLYHHCRGIDERPLVYKHERKSVSSEVNYGIRFKDNVEAEKFIKQLVQEVHTRLIQVNMQGKCITLKLMVRSKNAPIETSKFMGHGVCDNVTKSTSLATATADLNIISREIFSIYRKLNLPSTELRGIGIQISKLEKLNKSTAKNVLTDFLKPIDPVKTKVNEKRAVHSSTDVVTNEKQNMFRPLQINIPKIKLTSPEDEDDEENDPEIDFDDFSRYVSTGDTCSQEVKEKLKSIILLRHSKNNSKEIEKLISCNDLSKVSEKKQKTEPDRTLSIAVTRSSNNTDDVKRSDNSLPVCVVKPLLRNGKGRGRPKGSHTKNIKNSNMNLYSYLKPQNKTIVFPQKSGEKPTMVETKSSILPTEQIDLKFLAELPDDIRQEVIQEYNLQNISNLQKNDNVQHISEVFGKDDTNNQNIIPDLNLNINDHVKLTEISSKKSYISSSISEKTSIQLVNIAKIQINTQITPDTIDKRIENMFSSSDSLRIFMQLNYKQIKQLIHIWANTHEKILDDDIELLKSYFSLLAHQNKIEDLFMFFKFMYNQVLKAKNCNWHIAYIQIVSAIQDIVFKKYGGKLWVYKDFHCEECKDKI